MGMLETLGVVLLVVLALVLGWNARGNAGNATGKRPSGRRIQPANAALVFFSTCIVVALARLIYSPESVDELAVTNRPIEVQADGHVTSRTCQACHPDQYNSWYHSYHRSMTQVATPETVAGDFETFLDEQRTDLFALFTGLDRDECLTEHSRCVFAAKTRFREIRR